MGSFFGNPILCSMAGLTSAPIFKNPPRLSQSHKPLSLQSFTFHFRLHAATGRSVSTAKSTVSASYGGGVSSRRSKTNDDEALNISSIGSSTVRLIDEQQRMVGLVSKTQALQMADDAELDLVILSPDADPPVVKIMDYNKYRYEQQKKKRDQQKKTAAGRMDLKELKMGCNIDVHDYTVRLKAAQKFLKDGDKVKVIVNLKGRENEYRNNAIELLRRFQNDVGESAIEESKSFRERNIFIILVPNKAVAQKSQEPQKKNDDTAATEVPAGV